MKEPVTKDQISYDSIYMKYSEQTNLLSQSIDWLSPRAGGNKGTEVMAKEYGVSFGAGESVLKFI